MSVVRFISDTHFYHKNMAVKREFTSKEDLLAECNAYFKQNMVEGIVVRTFDSKFSAKCMNLEYDSKK